MQVDFGKILVEDDSSEIILVGEGVTGSIDLHVAFEATDYWYLQVLGPWDVDLPEGESDKYGQKDLLHHNKLYEIQCLYLA